MLLVKKGSNEIYRNVLDSMTEKVGLLGRYGRSIISPTNPKITWKQGRLWLLKQIYSKGTNIIKVTRYSLFTKAGQGLKFSWADQPGTISRWWQDYYGKAQFKAVEETLPEFFTERMGGNHILFGWTTTPWDIAFKSALT